jgi:hypothetical protein
MKETSAVHATQLPASEPDDGRTISDDELLRLRAVGCSYQAIAAIAGVSRQRVHDRVHRLQRRRRIEAEGEAGVRPATGLEADPATPLRAYRLLMSVRAWNALALWFGVKEPTVGDVRGLGVRLLRVPTFGRVSYREVCGLFGIPNEALPQKAMRDYPQLSANELRNSRNTTP